MTNNEIISQLENLEKEYVAGQLQNILYRIALMPWLLNEISNSNEDVKASYYQWFDVNDKYNIEIIESLISMYKFDGIVMNNKIGLYFDYPEYFNRVTQWILGKDTWRPNEQAHATAIELSHDLTAAVLNNLFEKSN